MTYVSEISKADCELISRKILEDVFKPALNFKISIFLCGADISDKSSIRYKIAQVLTSRYDYAMYYDLIYPEEIFEELLFSSRSPDLLSLENLLADSVDAVVMIPESPGSFTELGAFANNEKLRPKLICVIDEKYKKNKSFINQGPIKLVRKTNKANVVYIKPDEIGKSSVTGIKTFSLFSSDIEVDKIITSLRKLKKSSSSEEKNVTLLQLDRYLLPAIYLLEPVSKLTLIELVSCIMKNSKYSASSVITALSVLSKKRYIELTDEGYRLTDTGTNEFLSFRRKSSRFKEQEKTVAIDNLRLEIFNLKYRKKKLKV